MNFVAIKTPEQSHLLSLHRVRSRLVRQRTAIINQIRGFLIERGITVRQGPRPLRKLLPDVSSSPSKALSPRILHLIAELDQDWRRLDERIEVVSAEIESHYGAPVVEPRSFLSQSGYLPSLEGESQATRRRESLL